jgi:hypothetical protein
MLFVVLTFISLRSQRTAVICLAGVLLGIGATMRFSEAIFLVPAVGQLLVERRFVQAGVFAVTFCVVAAGIQAGSDTLYWGQPFFSLRNIVDYTLVQGRSSRGYQPPIFYVTELTGWTNYFVFALALYGTRRTSWRAALWTYAPIAMLSLLPHKEPRYLIPVVPFVSVLAACGLDSVLTKLTAPARPAAWTGIVGALLVVGAWGAALHEFRNIPFRRSEAAVQFARTLNVRRDGVGLAAEQVWRFGGPLYLPNSVQVDIDAGRMAERAYIATCALTPGIGWVAISTARCQEANCSYVLAGLGYVERDSIGGIPSGYRMFEKRRR